MGIGATDATPRDIGECGRLEKCLFSKPAQPLPQPPEIAGAAYPSHVVNDNAEGDEASRPMRRDSAVESRRIGAPISFDAVPYSASRHEPGYETYDRGFVLAPEATGKVKSWCGWCDRIIPDEREKQEWGIGPCVVAGSERGSAW
jgi:hypothetical protein